MPEPETRAVNVLVFGAEPPAPLVARLRESGFNAAFAADAAKVMDHPPDLVLFSSDNGRDSAAELRKILMIHQAPLIHLGVPADGIMEEIDDYLPLPYDYEYLAFKIRALSRRVQRERDINPLTGLPGNRLINECLERAFTSGDRSVVYIDINDFKPYNDTYGFAKGDEVIKALGRVLSTVIAGRSSDSLVGHIGGDDFIVICPINDADALIQEVIKEFENCRYAFYSAKDLSRGLIVGLDREGRRRKFPLLSLSMVSFHASKEHFRSAAEIAKRAMYLKKRLKARECPQGNSVHLRDGEEHGMAESKKLEALARSSALPLQIRRSLIEALGESGDRSFLPLLKELLTSSESEKIRKSALYALGRLKDPEAVLLLTRHLADPDPHLRTRAVEALGEIGSNEAYVPVRMLSKDKNRFVRQKVMEAFGKLANSDSLDELEKAANDPDGDVAEAAIRALGELRNPSSVPLLEKCLTNTNTCLRRAAIAALGGILCPDTAHVICDCLDDRDPGVRWQALCRIPSFIERGLCDGKRGFVLERLLFFAGAAQSPLKRAAVIALGPLRERRALPLLHAALNDRNDMMRWSAALSLGKIGDSGSLAVLLKRLKDSDDIVRSAASWALGQVGDQRAVEPLRQALKDQSPRVREAASSSIVRIILKNQVSC